MEILSSQFTQKCFFNVICLFLASKQQPDLHVSLWFLWFTHRVWLTWFLCDCCLSCELKLISCPGLGFSLGTFFCATRNGQKSTEKRHTTISLLRSAKLASEDQPFCPSSCTTCFPIVWEIAWVKKHSSTCVRSYQTLHSQCISPPNVLFTMTHRMDSRWLIGILHNLQSWQKYPLAERVITWNFWRLPEMGNEMRILVSSWKCILKNHRNTEWRSYRHDIAEDTDKALPWCLSCSRKTKCLWQLSWAVFHSCFCDPKHIHSFHFLWCLFGAAWAGPPPPPMGGGGIWFPPSVVWGWFVVLW